MLNMGFIGLGNMGLHQVNSFAKSRRCRIVAGSDLAPASCKRFAEAYPDAAVYSDHRKLLKDGRIDAVLVAAPTGFHKAIVLDALRSGRDVITEKPMARTVADCRRMNDAADKAGKLLMVAQCRRYDTDWGTWGKLVTAGKLGGPLLWRHVMAGMGPRPAWFMDDKLGGGPLIDGAVHNQDFAVKLFGDPVEVVAAGITLDNCTAVDTATAVITYTSGSQLMLSWSWAAAPGDAAFDILGPKATLVQTRDDKGTAYTVRNRKTAKETIHRVKPSDMYVRQARHFVDCVQGKATCKSPGTEAIKAVASAEALLKCAHAGSGKRKIVW